ncbi:MAG: hypothetical protein ACAI34_13775 [Verrucomicrobium sp.]|nr:hypothetical protein [Verrucomicrobium sp.]
MSIPAFRNPIRVGRLELTSRIVMAPMGQYPAVNGSVGMQILQQDIIL